MNNITTSVWLRPSEETKKTDWSDVFNHKTQEYLICSLLDDAEAFKQCRHALKGHYFDASLSRSIKFICHHFDTTGKLPDRQLIMAQTGSEYVNLPDVEPADRTWLLSHIEQFCRHKATENLLLEAYDMLQAGKHKEIEERIKEANSISIINRTKSSFLFEGEIMAQPPVEYLIDEWLPLNALIAMWGQSKTQKSFAALAMALHITHGMPWHGQETRQGAVCYVAAEGAGGIGKRVRAWKQHHKKTDVRSPFITKISAVNLTVLAEIDQLINDLKEIEATTGVKFQLLVLDTLARCMTGAEENSNTMMGLAVHGADRIREAMGCTVLIVHHAGKNEANGPRGGYAFFAALDTSIHVERDGNTVTLTLDKQKDDEDGIFKHFESTIVNLEPSGSKPETSVVLVEKNADEAHPFAVPEIGTPIDPVYADLQMIAAVLADNQDYSITKAAEAVFRDKNKAKRIDEAVPDVWMNVQLADGRVKSIRKVKAEGKGYKIQTRLVTK